MLAADFNLRAVRGKTERFEIEVTVRDEDGVVVPDATLAGWTLYLTLKESLGETDAQALFAYTTGVDDQLEVVDEVNRLARFTLQPADYDALARWQDYPLLCEITGVNGAGDVIDLATGYLTIELPVRRAVP